MSASTPQEIPTYPLHDVWTLWYNGPKSAPEKHQWMKRFKKITNFDTVQDFWRLFNNLSPPSVLSPGSDFHLFKEGITPEWEHPKNEGGGSWTCRMHIKDPNAIDQAWFQLALALIGNNFVDGAHITGLVISVRKSNARLSIWTSALNPEKKNHMKIIKRIGHQMRARVEVKSKNFTFTTHKDNKTKPYVA